MKLPRSLSASAFLVNVSRARRVDISQDVYAHLWVTPESSHLWDEYASEVYPYDDIELGLRNRFFLEAFREFVRAVDRPVCVNIASGFTSYPFLVEANCRWIEVDLEPVISFKRRQVASWVRDGTLPDRNIQYLPSDLRQIAQRTRLQRHLKEMIGEDPSFILFEGISYYLDGETQSGLGTMCTTIQKTGSRLACDFWDHLLAENPTFQRLIQFFSSRFGYATSGYSFLEPEWFHHIPGYTVVRESDIQTLEEVVLQTSFLKDSDAIIPEHYVIMQKQ